MEGWGLGWCGPDPIGIGPVPATRKLMGRLGWEWNELDLVELNEAFAAQALAVLKELPIPEDRVNVNGERLPRTPAGLQRGTILQPCFTK